MLACALLAAAQPATELHLRGYSVIPQPRTVKLQAGDVPLGMVELAGVPENDIILRQLRAEWPGRRDGAPVRLAIRAGAVETKAEPALDRQGYRIAISDRAIELTGNAHQGLFYAAQTLMQLAKRDPAGRFVVPRGVIEDWPALELRFIHWDTKHHQNRMETLKRYLDWSARFKANMIGFEIEDKFAYPSHPVIGAPGAFTPQQMQELVNYGLERHIQLVPEVQSPAHFAYVLKHPEFAHLRADGNNYQTDICDPRTYELIFSMYDDLIKATKGVNYFFVSTDEVYYAGMGSHCAALRPYNEENRSLTWVEFVQKANDFLKQRGRTMLVWAEYPLLPKHYALLPPGIIDGVVGSPQGLPIEKERGIRQLSYNSMQGGEYLFPSHLPLESPDGLGRSNLRNAYREIGFGKVWKGNPAGVFGAAWDDNGLHDETFWLGWSAVMQWGWNPRTVSPEQHTAEFMNVYYGPGVTGMVELYRTMERQARAYETTWDHVVSKVRAPGYGNSYGKGVGTTRHDLTLALPGLPQLPSLSYQNAWREKYSRMLETARRGSEENDRLVHALFDNMSRAERNTYNLEVFLEVARFIGHRWRLLNALGAAEKSLVEAEAAAQKKNARQAVGLMVQAYTGVDRAHQEGVSTFAELKTVWEKSRYPKGQSVGGRKFVHVLDDVKDHFADRRPDLSYMTAPEESMNVSGWLKSLLGTIQTYAKQNSVPVRGLEEARLEQ